MALPDDYPEYDPDWSLARRLKSMRERQEYWIEKWRDSRTLDTGSDREAKRAVAPLVGVILLWAIVSLVIAILAYVAFGGVT